MNEASSVQVRVLFRMDKYGLIFVLIACGVPTRKICWLEHALTSFASRFLCFVLESIFELCH